MKNTFSSACLLLVSVTLTVGCGGTELEGTEDAQGPATVEQDNLPSLTEADRATEEEFTSREQEEGRTVGDFAACCYVACTGDNRPGHFYGPFRSVSYGNCSNYAAYYCGQRGWTVEQAKWDNC
jgi:hypothetical protein